MTPASPHIPKSFDTSTPISADLVHSANGAISPIFVDRLTVGWVGAPRPRRSWFLALNEEAGPFLVDTVALWNQSSVSASDDSGNPRLLWRVPGLLTEMHHGLARGLGGLCQSALRRTPTLLPCESVHSDERRYLKRDDDDMHPEVNDRRGRAVRIWE